MYVKKQKGMSTNAVRSTIDLDRLICMCTVASELASSMASHQSRASLRARDRCYAKMHESWMARFWESRKEGIFPMTKRTPNLLFC